MGWGLGGASRRLGSCCSRHPPRPWRPLPFRAPGCGQPSRDLGGRGPRGLLGPGRAETSRRRRSSCSLRCRLPLPSDNKRKAASTSQLPWQPRPPGSCWQRREGVWATPGLGPPGGREGRGWGGPTWGQGSGWGRGGQQSSVMGWGGTRPTGRSPRLRHLMSAVWGRGVGRGTWA